MNIIFHDMILNMLGVAMVVGYLFAVQTVHGQSSGLLATVAASRKPRNNSQTAENKGFQKQDSLSDRQTYDRGDLGLTEVENITDSSHRSKYVHTGNQGKYIDGEYNAENSRPSNVSKFRIEATNDTIEKKPKNIKQLTHKSRGNPIQVSDVNEKITGESNTHNNTTEGIDKRYKRNTGKKTSTVIQASTTPEPVSTAPPDPVQAYQNAHSRLKKFILNQHNVVHRLAPYNIKYGSRANTSDVSLKFTPIRILFMDEVQQSITVSSFMMVRWHDNSFTWDPNKFGNITETFIQSNKLWTPTIILPTSTGHGLYLDTTDYVLVTSKLFPTRAVLSMKFPFQFTLQCEFDMTRYPFDEQTCVIIFRELNENPLSALTTKETDFEMARSLHTSGEWEIIDWHNLNRSEEEPFTLKWRIKLRRQSQFFVANLIIPMIQTSLMTLLVFWIPAESGEKMSFVVSMFVSTSVFLFTINDEMPRSIRQLPTINILVVVVTSEIILVAVASLYVLKRCRYLQKVKNSNTSLKYATELGHRARNAEANSGEVPIQLCIKQIANHLTHTQSTLEYVKSKLQTLVELNTGSCNIDHKEFAARIDKSDSSAKTTFKFGISETDKNHLKFWGEGLYSHETLDKIFFCVFLFINLIVGILAYFSWF